MALQEAQSTAAAAAAVAEADRKFTSTFITRHLTGEERERQKTYL